MASRFWVGGTGNTSDTAHWSATTGGAGGQTVPVAGDTVDFDTNSGTAATVTVDVALAAASITINKSDLTLTHSAGTTLTGNMTLTTGTLNTNGMTCSWGSFSSGNNNIRTLTLGASAITVTSTGSSWSVSGNNLSLSAGTSSVILSGAGATFATGNFTWGSVALSGSGTGTLNLISASAIFANLTRAGTAAKTDIFSVGGNCTVTGTCTLGGNTTQGVNRLLVRSNTVGISRTITAAAYVITGDCDFMDINLAYSGAASWTNVGNAHIGDALGNAGAVTTNATVAVTRYWVGNGGNWSDASHWSTSSGGSSGASVPLPQDTALFDANSISSTGQIVTLDMSRLSTIDETGLAKNMQLVNGSLTVYLFGSLKLVSAGNGWSSISTVYFYNRVACTVDFANKSVGYTVRWGVTSASTYTLAGHFNGNAAHYLQAGSLNLSSYNLNAGLFDVNVSGVTITFGTGTLTLSGSYTTTVWTANAGSVINGAGSGGMIDITDATSGNTLVFAGAGKSYPTLRHRSAGSSALSITGNNTFATLDLECTTARTITSPAGGTQTITGTLTLLGAAGQLLSLRSSSTGTKWYINAATTSAQYCDVKDSTATGTGTPIDNSTGGVDSGNNIGWLFSAGGSAGYSSTLLTLGVG